MKIGRSTIKAKVSMYLSLHMNEKTNVIHDTQKSFEKLRPILIAMRRSIFENGRRSSKVVKKLGTYADLLKKLNGKDSIDGAKKYVDQLIQKEKEDLHGNITKI